MVIPGPNVPAGQKSESSSVTSNQDSKTPSTAIIQKNELVESKEEVTKKKAGFLRPYFDEATLFSISITLILLCLMSRTLWTDVYNCYKSPQKDFLQMFFMFVFIFAGACHCIFHAFSKREKHQTEKYFMLAFAILVSSYVGVYGGLYLLKRTQGFLVIFPTWNIIYSSLLYLKYRRGKINLTNVSDKNAPLPEIIVTGVMIFIVILCCEFWFKLHWLITFSICLTYTTTLNRALRGLFGPN
jgi:hypothetical protein